MSPGTSTSTHILSGWKDIANYLGKGVRTVQRYEEEFRPPVRRPAGRSRGSVVAIRAELDAWVAASPIREEQRAGLNPGLRRASSLAGITQNLREMRILREQMRDLHSDMKRSVCLLQTRLTEIQGRVQEKNAAALDGVSQFSSDWPLHRAGDFEYPKAS